MLRGCLLYAREYGAAMPRSPSTTHGATPGTIDGRPARRRLPHRKIIERASLGSSGGRARTFSTRKQNQGIYDQDWQIEDNFAAEAAFRLGISALTLARP